MARILLAGVTVLAMATLSHTTAAQDLKPATITRVTLERTPCMGMCPTYTVVASRGGVVAFEGRDNVKVQGERRGKVAAKDFAAIAAGVVKIGFMGLNDTYMTYDDGCTQVSMDNPSIKITVQAGGRNKQVWYDLGCKGAPPLQDIAWLADLIDEKAGAVRWTK